MKRVVHNAHGAPGYVLDVLAAPLADPGPDEVQVMVLAAPVLPADRQPLAGPQPSSGAGISGVGRVTAGPRWIGELVVLPLNAGSWSQRVNVPIEGCIPLFTEVDPVQAALARVNGLTAQALLAGLERGSWVAMNAGNGSVSRWVQRIARRMGVKTAVLVRPTAERSAIEADLVVDDDASAVAAIEATIDGPLHRAFDGVGGESTERLGAVLSNGGRVVHYAATSGQSPRLLSIDSIARGVLLQGFSLDRLDAMRGPDEAGQILVRLLELGFTEAVDSTWTLDALQDALARSTSADRLGQVVFTPNALLN